MSSRSERASSSAISEARPCSARRFLVDRRREGEQAAQLQAAPRWPGDAERAVASLRAGSVLQHAAAQQRRVIYDHGQQVVEIVGDTSDQVADCFELLRSVQSRLGRPMFGHFGLQTEIGFGQAEIGRLQFEAQPQRLCEDFAEVPSRQRQRRHEHNDHCRKRAVSGRALREKAQSHWQACRQEEGQKRGQMRRADRHGAGAHAPHHDDEKELAERRENRKQDHPADAPAQAAEQRSASRQP